MELRNQLDLFAYTLHCKSFPGVETRYKDIDIVIIRQNTEGEYAMLEHEVQLVFLDPVLGVDWNRDSIDFTQNVSGVVESLKVVTRANSERLARYAFETAQKMGRKKVTVVHKANIM